MKIILTKEKLSEATAKGLITQKQEEVLWSFLITDPDMVAEPSKVLERESAFVKMLYYAGTFIIIGAMGWFMNRAWDSWHGAGVAAIALVYAHGFGLAGWVFSKKSELLSNLLWQLR